MHRNTAIDAGPPGNRSHMALDEVGGGARFLCAFMTQELVDAWCRDIEQRRLVMEAHDAYKNWERMSACTHA